MYHEAWHESYHCKALRISILHESEVQKKAVLWTSLTPLHLLFVRFLRFTSSAGGGPCFSGALMWAITILPPPEAVALGASASTRVVKRATAFIDYKNLIWHLDVRFLISFAPLRIFDVIFEVWTDLVQSNSSLDQKEVWYVMRADLVRCLVPISFASESDLRTPKCGSRLFLSKKRLLLI